MVSLFNGHETPSAWENSEQRTGKAANLLWRESQGDSAKDEELAISTAGP